MGEVVLFPDELEALRLADLEGLYQDAAAEVMGVSRPTFARILLSARKKVSDALFHAKSLSINEGHENMIENVRKFTCKDCGKEFELAYGGGRPEKCTECGGENFNRVGGCGAQIRRRRNTNLASAASGENQVAGAGMGMGRGRGCARGNGCGGGRGRGCV
ncbi:MAG: hypothetical protein A2018_03650 [Alphaproteobacteria bacterium GWF2_58_20]|nr:MAG: hypothetical protein A2018_03650 [Alphaproteobacteria bacterium GWF2_58_20]